MNDNYRGLLHSPEEMGELHLEYAKEIKYGKKMELGFPFLDRYVLPLMRGNLGVVIALSGHGKSTFLGMIGRYHAHKLKEKGKILRECIVHVTLEQSVEELETFYQVGENTFTTNDLISGKVGDEVLEEAAEQRRYLPLYMVGYSTMKANHKLPRMTTENILRAIQLMESDFGVRPKLVLFDYVQLIPVPRARDRVQQITEAPLLVKEVALRLGCPAIIAAQARRECEDRAWKMPGGFDAQWATSIRQAADRGISLWYLSETEPLGSSVALPDGSSRVAVHKDTMIIQCWKQRNAESGKIWVCSFDPVNLTLKELAIRPTDEPPPPFEPEPVSVDNPYRNV